MLAHELGHHVDGDRVKRDGILAKRLRRDTKEEQLTGYCTNDNEWFAEIFRLFVTNPQLLWKLRPKMFDQLQSRWPHFAEIRPWIYVLEGAERQIRAAENKIKAVEKRSRQLDLIK